MIIGLGNPGARYAKTRHNVGFMAVDALAARLGLSFKTKGSFAFAEGDGLVLIKPQTFMNLSGGAVLAAMQEFRIKKDAIAVIHDELDIPTGEMRLKTGGGAAGHNGLKSIDAAIGNDYARVRVGINHPRKLDLPLEPADWVLGRFVPGEMELVEPAIEKIIGMYVSEA